METKYSMRNQFYITVSSDYCARMTNLPEKFCLKWNDFQQNMLSSHQELRKEPEFSDVSLFCEDDYQIEAHRIILTACSPFFSTVLKTNKHSHPMIYMRGLKSKDLVAIVDFIYHGEANIAQEDLNGFLALAEELQLKGLTGSQHDAEDVEEETNKTRDETKTSQVQNRYQRNKEKQQNTKLQYLELEEGGKRSLEPRFNVTKQDDSNYDTESKYDTYGIVKSDVGKPLLNANMDDFKGQIILTYRWCCWQNFMFDYDL